MAGAMSSHLLGSFNANQSMNLITSGPMSFNSYMHGSQMFNAPFTKNSFISEELSEATAKKIAALQAKLNQKLGPEFISQRPGPGGGPKLTYAEGWKIINLANDVFGFNGWSSNLVSLATDFIDYNEESKRYTVGVTAIIRVTLRDGVYHEDVGYGILENSKSKGMALDKCKKEAVTDGLKRALRSFGNLLGNCLYDKTYAQEVVKMKVTPPKFDASELHRRPEFEAKPNITSSSNTNHASNAKMNNNLPSVDRNTTSSSGLQKSKAPPALPPHMKKEVNTTLSTGTSTRTGSPQTPLQQQQQNGSIASVSANNQPIQDSRGINYVGPRQQTIPPQRKVTFSNAPHPAMNPPNAIDTTAQSSRPPAVTSPRSVHADLEEESFGCSEDDAFFASVDLGDIDLGRPIDGDIDMSRPIDYDEGLGNTSVSHLDISTSTNNASRQMNPAGALPARSGASTDMVPRQQQRHPQRTSSTLSGGSWQDKNVPPAKTSVQTSATNNARSTTPSMGAFHFPPGMNPFQQQNQNRPPGQTYQSLGVKAGAKRPAESTPTNDRFQPGMKRGMSLHPAAQGGNGGREILGQLEGGDVKRIKR